MCGHIQLERDFIIQSMHETIPVTLPFSSTIDGEFKPVGDDSDDEETIDVEERQAAKAGEVSGPSEIELLQRESELPIEELLTSLQETQAKEAQGSEVKQEEKPSKDKPDVSLKDVVSSQMSKYLLVLYISAISLIMNDVPIYKDECSSVYIQGKIAHLVWEWRYDICQVGIFLSHPYFNAQGSKM